MQNTLPLSLPKKLNADLGLEAGLDLETPVLSGLGLLSLDYPRQTARQCIQNSVPADLWAANQNFVTQICRELAQHPVATHPMIAALNQGVFDRPQMQKIHLEYRHAIVQIFTDALLMAQVQSRQIEPRLAPGSKMSARFLLTLNNLDEFGYRPGVDCEGYYRGNPKGAHYPLFEQVLDALEISVVERQAYKPSDIAHQVRQYLEAAYSDFCALTSLLAVAEEEVVLFSAPLRHNVAAVGLDVSTGYYVCHGTSDDAEAEADDDSHEHDLWYVLMQGLTPDRYADIRQGCLAYCDLWVEFWDVQLSLLNTKQRTKIAA
jgi:hypothetical protein